MRYAFASALVFLLTTHAAPMAAKGIELDSREYKLMLEPDRFAGDAPEEAIEDFISDQLGPAIRTSFGDDAADELAAKGVDLEKRRSVLFRDTQGCMLNSNGFALRERVDLDEDGSRASDPEVTLKFRSPDLFLVTAMRLDAQAEEAETKLEEDIGPLSLTKGPDDRVVSMPRSTRSQFSRSTSQTVDPGALPQTLEEVDRLYPTFGDDLRFVAGEVDLRAALTPGPEYRELVYRSSKLDLTGHTKTEFSLTIWYQGAGNRTEPALAEVSFSYDTDHGEVPPETAQRARELLLAMQDLEWARADAPTKTALAACPDTPA
jgi:hypothetical protein